MSRESAVRSALFVPGSRPERFAKALASGAERVIVDFEDAVEEALKPQARDNLQTFLRDNPQASVVVRINAFGHPQHAADIAFCAAHPQLAAVMLPKAESAAQIQPLAAQGIAVWALIESAQGLANLAQVASAEGVERLTFGGLDLGLELGLASGSAAARRLLDVARYLLILHTALAGLARPIETVFPDIADSAGLQAFASDARDMGFGGMLCIHPSQVATAQQVFSPSEQQLGWARRVLAEAEGQAGAFRFEGRMVDAPVLEEARRLLAQVG